MRYLNFETNKNSIRIRNKELYKPARDKSNRVRSEEEFLSSFVKFLNPF